MLLEKIVSSSEQQTIELGKEFAKRLELGDVVAFFGDLGTGKTEFIKGICQYFKVEDLVTSPTFTIMNRYSGLNPDSEIAIFHIDLYRITKKEELGNIGFDECMYSPHSIKLVEWAENASGMLPKSIYSVRIVADPNDENKRYISIERDFK